MTPPRRPLVPALLAFIAVGGLGPLAAAQEPAPGPGTLVTFEETAGRDVARDRFRASLTVEAEGFAPAEVQGAINARMARALARARGVGAVAAETSGYALYQDPESKSWRGSQGLELDSPDPALLTRLVGGLQGDGLIVGGLDGYVSEDARDRAEDALMIEAVARAEARLGRLAAALRAASSRITELALDPDGVLPYRAAGMAAESRAMSASAVAPPSVEAGVERVEVRLGVTARLLP